MGVADFPIEIFRAVKKQSTKRAETTSTVSKESTSTSGETTPSASATGSRATSQLDLGLEETAEPKSYSSEASSQRASTSMRTPKSSYDGTRSSTEIFQTQTETPLTSTTSLPTERQSSLKQALRGTLNRARSRSASRDRGSMSRSESRDRRPGSRSGSPFGSHRKETKEFDPSHLTLENAARTGKGVSRIVGAGLKSPMDFALGIARGFHNAPKLYGDDTVRPQEKVTDFQSGLKAAGKVKRKISIFEYKGFLISNRNSVMECGMESLG
jgi:hypothetical protein